MSALSPEEVAHERFTTIALEQLQIELSRLQMLERENRELRREVERYRARECPRCAGVPDGALAPWKGAKRVGPLLLADGMLIEPVGVRVNPPQLQVLARLMHAYPYPCSNARLNGGRYPNQREHHQLRTRIHRLRRALAPYGVEIDTRFMGDYRLVVSLPPDECAHDGIGMTRASEPEGGA